MQTVTHSLGWLKKNARKSWTNESRPVRRSCPLIEVHLPQCGRPGTAAPDPEATFNLRGHQCARITKRPPVRRARSGPDAIGGLASAYTRPMVSVRWRPATRLSEPTDQFRQPLVIVDLVVGMRRDPQPNSVIDKMQRRIGAAI